MKSKYRENTTRMSHAQLKPPITQPQCCVVLARREKGAQRKQDGFWGVVVRENETVVGEEFQIVWRFKITEENLKHALRMYRAAHKMVADKFR